MSFKPYPLLPFHPPGHRRNPGDPGSRTAAPDDIATVRLPVDNLHHDNVVCEPLPQKQNPANTGEAQLALPYIVAAVLVRGRLSVPDLSPASMREPVVHDVAAQLVPEISPEARHGTGCAGYPLGYPPPGAWPSRSARPPSCGAEVPVTKGDPERMLSESECIAKFRECATAGNVPADAQDEILDRVLWLEDVDDASMRADALLSRERKVPHREER